MNNLSNSPEDLNKYLASVEEETTSIPKLKHGAWDMLDAEEDDLIHSSCFESLSMTDSNEEVVQRKKNIVNFNL